jgi:hypothetical protein
MIGSGRIIRQSMEAKGPAEAELAQDILRLGCATRLLISSL